MGRLGLESRRMNFLFEIHLNFVVENEKSHVEKEQKLAKADAVRRGVSDNQRLISGKAAVKAPYK